MSFRTLSGTFTEDGESSAIPVREAARVMVGSVAGGDFGSGTVTLQIRGADGNWYPSADTFTEADARIFEARQPCSIRLSLAGSSSPDLDYSIVADVVSV